jgi:hypothetical protein
MFSPRNPALNTRKLLFASSISAGFSRKSACKSFLTRDGSNMVTRDFQMSVSLSLHHCTMSLMHEIRADRIECLAIYDPRLSKTNDVPLASIMLYCCSAWIFKRCRSFAYPSLLHEAMAPYSYQRINPTSTYHFAS